ncbi:MULTISPECIES: hypothetical protein [unclassified Tolypothrix]|uniref:Uncharacterized protein n=1 Tax=Microchaete diplosiphon TaxID=1197 RepID=Q6GZX6_MICDP|nr:MULTISPECIES: hypothetical protein [unclassified Tolypothrix]AAT41993.1 hypothetical protein [Fremyella diplosiphon Fd33]BAY89660.1 hypothetical protein NIES3275_16630 [Microchaete diplosiphon NIES-3275]EKE97645.1 hypothetical protein FDUTEX481_05023 [Tolypothrix sp. PCC 7601]MBE9083220.1 hypothetical protein [Tolypothrix sp. LEGE 11397]UYD23930.1 hypothetical protein HGR01_20735 [Tolypothrix sp. PCC 7712]
MALPEGFSPFEHLQDMIRLNHNKIVRSYFSDVGDDDWVPEITSTRGALRTACTMLDSDTADMTLMRLYFLYDVLGYARSNLAVFYGSHDSVEAPVTGHPKVCFYFSQDAESVAQGKQKLDAEYSFRLVDETQSTITETKARTLATEIKNLFISARQGIVLTKSKTQYLYFHKERGYRLRIYGNTEADAVDIIQKLLQLTNTTYDQDRLTVAVPKRSNTATPETQVVYGKSTKKKQFRPTANVRFRYAYMEIPGKPIPVFLVDTTFRYGGLVAI